MATGSHPTSARKLNHLQTHIEQLDVPQGQPADSLAAAMWQASQSIANAALNTDYIQGIKNGDLDPNNYGIYTVQDSVYCYHAAQDYRVALARAIRPDVKAFIAARLAGYEAYNKEVFTQWHIEQPDAIGLSPAAQAYSQFESEVARDDQVLYLIVAMIPCERLWSRLAGQLKQYATPDNLYSFWITENLSDKGALRLEAFVDAHAAQLDADKATAIYQRCMHGELGFFESAVP